ncbi:Chloride channel CLIC-like protein 1 [Aphelenchoides fujianensis]|nr:Chloride channel CLIC-like protein 1 [Aphelenchoides fujianensis]
MPLPLIFCLLLLLSVHPIAADEPDVNLQLDKSGWVDLSDPLGAGRRPGDVAVKCENEDELNDCRRKNEELLRMNEELRTQRPNSVDVLLKHVLRQFFLKLDVDVRSSAAVDRHAHVRLSEVQMTVVRSYLGSQKENEEVGLRERLRDVLENFLIRDDVGDGLFVHLVRWLPTLCLLNVIVLPLAALIILRKITSLRVFLGFFLISSFCCSYYFTRFSRSDVSNNSCAPQGLVAEAVDVLLSYVRIKGKNRCLQQYEDMLIEPFLLVDPLQVFGEVVTSFLMSPFSVLGLHLNKACPA